MVLVRDVLINAINNIEIGSDFLNTKLSNSLEDYLEAIYILEKNNQTIRITDIACMLEISKPSVNKAVASLKESGFVNHEKYGNILLTTKGREIAKEVYYIHNTLKEFLINELKIDPKIAEQEACGIEHVISRDSLNKLVEYSRNKTN